MLSWPRLRYQEPRPQGVSLTNRARMSRASTSAPSSWRSLVDPSTSVKRKVTVPVGRSDSRGVIIRPNRAPVQPPHPSDVHRAWGLFAGACRLPSSACGGRPGSAKRTCDASEPVTGHATKNRTNPARGIIPSARQMRASHHLATAAASRLSPSDASPSRRARMGGDAWGSRNRPAQAMRLGKCPRHESNMRTRFRKPLLYPLSYGGARTA